MWIIYIYIYIKYLPPHQRLFKCSTFSGLIILKIDISICCFLDTFFRPISYFFYDPVLQSVVPVCIFFSYICRNKSQKLSGLKQHSVLRFWRTEAWNGSHWTKIMVTQASVPFCNLQGRSYFCAFWAPRCCLGSLACGPLLSSKPLMLCLSVPFLHGHISLWFSSLSPSSTWCTACGDIN